jgi:DNA-binding transcriptional LysR family regulator
MTENKYPFYLRNYLVKNMPGCDEYKKIIKDFYRDSVDIALRYGSPKDAKRYGFKICYVPTLLCASPTYLEKHGTPKHPN